MVDDRTPADNGNTLRKRQQEFTFDRGDRFRWLRGANFGDPLDFGRRNLKWVKILIEVLEMHHAADGSCYLTQSEIAELMECSIRTVSATLKIAKELFIVGTERRCDRGGQRANRTWVIWENVRRYAYGDDPREMREKISCGGNAESTKDPERKECVALSEECVALSEECRPIKGDIRFIDPVNKTSPLPPEGNGFAGAAAGIVGISKQDVKPPRFDRKAFAGVEEQLRELGVRNVTRAIQAARRRGMTPAGIEAIISEFRGKIGDFDDPPAVLFARLVDLDEWPLESPAARRRKQERKRKQDIAAQAERDRAQARARDERRRRAADCPQWAELTAEECRPWIELIQERFPNKPPRMVEQFARSHYITETNRGNDGETSQQDKKTDH